MICPTYEIPYNCRFALVVDLPHIWYTLRVFLVEIKRYKNNNCWFTLLMKYPTIVGLPCCWFTPHMLYPLLVMIITIQLKSVRSVFCEYLNFKFSLVEKYSYCFSLSKRILILLFLRLFLAFFLLFCNVSQTLKWPSNQGFLQWAHLLTCGTTMETGGT